MLEVTVRGGSSEANHAPTSMYKLYSLSSQTGSKGADAHSLLAQLESLGSQVPTSCLAGCPACGGRLSPHLPRLFGDKQDDRVRQWDID